MIGGGHKSISQDSFFYRKVPLLFLESMQTPPGNFLESAVSEPAKRGRSFVGHPAKLVVFALQIRTKTSGTKKLLFVNYEICEKKVKSLIS